MSTKISPLDSRLAALVRSPAVVASVQDVARELLQNSVDAGASQIELTAMLSSDAANDFTWGFKCSDNGHGIAPSELKNIGRRFFTSKAVCSENASPDEVLSKITTFGFRGEALNSIKDICSTLHVVSKVEDFNGTFKTSFFNGKSTGSPSIVQDSSQRINAFKSGTVISLIDLFGTLPVRKNALKNLNWHILTSDIRLIVFSTLVFYPHISFKFYKSANSERKLIFSCDGSSLVLQSSTTGLMKSQLGLFKSIYGSSLMKNYESFNATFKDYKLQAMVGFDFVQTKAYQFVFMNNRLLKSETLMKAIDKQFQAFDFGTENQTSKLWGKPFSKYPIFIIFITCKLESSDLFQDPTKNIYFTKHMDVILAMVLKVIKVLCQMEKNRVIMKSPSKKRKLTEDLKQSIYKDLEKASEETLGPSHSAAILKSHNRYDNLKKKSIQSLVAVEGKHDKPNRIHNPLLNYSKFAELRTNSIHISKHKHGTTECDSCHNDGNLNDLDVKSLDVNELKFISPFFERNEIELNVLDFNDIIVVNQVGSKFILTTFKTFFAKPLVVIIDQHACDERIKVEALYKSCIEETILNTDPDLESFKLKVPLEIELSSEEIDLFAAFEKDMNMWRIIYSFRNSATENSVTNGNGGIAYITHLPLIISQRIGTDSYLLKNGLRDFINDLKTKRKIVPSFNSHMGWWEYIPQLPDMFQEIIRSKACRSAIMFGDELTLDECKLLVRNLCECRSPFWCAHGRPSMYPVADLSD